ncbi:DNA polymerase III subunit delta [Verrucomicrobiales bacterium BCK34]|nr:DNA polymerase III subunit delta [Verrucomicrobiales bacterium BCK34]
MAGASNIHAFFGTDEARVKEGALLLSRKIAPQDDEFGLEIIAGAADNADHASQIVGRTIEAIQTLPFFGGEKVVWLQGATFFSDTQTGKAETTLRAVEALVDVLESGLPAEVQVIISATDVDKRRVFYKKIGKLTKPQIFDKVDISKQGWEAQVMTLVRKKSDELGLTFAGDALERFVLMVGAETRMLDSEIEKLSLYVGDKPATEEDVSRIAASSHIGVIFEIGDTIARKNLPKALDLIDRQLSQGESAVGILLASIVPKVRSLLHARDLIERHGLRPGRSFPPFQSAIDALPKSETAHLPRKKDGNVSAYPLFLAAQISNRFTVKELKVALDACLEANLRLVTTSLDPKLVLNQLVTRILT